MKINLYGICSRLRPRRCYNRENTEDVFKMFIESVYMFLSQELLNKPTYRVFFQEGVILHAIRHFFQIETNRFPIDAFWQSDGKGNHIVSIVHCSRTAWPRYCPKNISHYLLIWSVFHSCILDINLFNDGRFPRNKKIKETTRLNRINYRSITRYELNLITYRQNVQINGFRLRDKMIISINRFLLNYYINAPLLNENSNCYLQYTGINFNSPIREFNYLKQSFFIQSNI